jgi:hypothetical protein
MYYLYTKNIKLISNFNLLEKNKINLNIVLIYKDKDNDNDIILEINL